MQKTILKLETPLSNKGMYVEVNDPSVTLDTLIHETVASLQHEGKTLESAQLESLFQTHQVHINGMVISKGTLVSEIPTATHVVNGETIKYQELMLMTEHVGGLPIPDAQGWY